MNKISNTATSAWSPPHTLTVDPHHIYKLLYSTKTRRFLAPDGTWTKERHLARQFETPDAALDQIHALKEPDVVVYYAFSPQDSTEFDFQIAPSHDPRTP